MFLLARAQNIIVLNQKYKKSPSAGRKVSHHLGQLVS